MAGEWSTLYAFDLDEQQLPDYEVSNWYLCHHPDSHFLKGIVAARAAPDRRHALRMTRYAVHYPGGASEKRFITEVDEYRELLAGPFQIRLPDAPNLDERLARMIAANPPA